MRPRLVSFFEATVGMGFFVPDYAFLQAIAVVLGVYLVVRQAEHDGLETRRVFIACLATIGVALVGARLYIVIVRWEYYRLQPWQIWQFWHGGTASFGAYLAGGLAALVAARWQRLPVRAFLDSCAPAVALAIVLGRLGCFFNGCCFGRESDLPWALRFPEGSGPYLAQLDRGLIAPLQLSHPVHPVQLYEAGLALALFVFLLWYRKRQRQPGELIALLFMLYPLIRFGDELLRGDDRGHILLLSVPQFFCVVVFALAGTFWLWSHRRQIPGQVIVEPRFLS